MPTPKDSKVDYSALVDMNQKDILAEMRAGRLVAPPKGTEDRKSFEAFCALDAGSEDRKKYLESPAPEGDGSGGKADGDGSPPDEGRKEGDGTERKPDEGPASTPPPPASDEWAGYGSREKLLEAHESMKGSVDNLTKQVRKLRSTDGKLGQKVKDLETQIASKETELEDLRKKSAGTPPKAGDETPPKAPSKKPTRPKAADFEDGEADTGYIEALDKFYADQDDYIGGLESRLANVDSKLAKLDDLEKKADEAHQFASNATRTAAESKTDQAFSSMWDTTRSIQKELGLETKADIETINEHWLNRNSEDADAKAAAEKYLNALPEADVKNFTRVAPIVNAMFSFGDDGPKKVYPNVQAALWATVDEVGKPLAEQYKDLVVPGGSLSQSQADSVRRQQDESESAAGSMSSSDLGGGDTPLSQQTKEEKLSRLRDLQMQRKKNVRGFDANQDLWKEYSALMKDLNFASSTSAPSTVP